ncbi:MAG: TonB-dependent receptor, partial [Bacteroidota bacterium]|nr:TonB-dependent receptor [Bacteroidota bacterium]MDX5506344.1 TonB-dependent receptor [Bacteroidota bacterium]
HRTGINEVDLVDYDTENLKFSTSLHYKIKPDLQLIYGFNFGYGTTVYQGDNRYSLKDIRFFQNKLELRKENKFYVRAYATNENAGNSYDAYFTALKMQDSYLNDQGYENLYRTLWNVFYVHQVKNLPGYPDDSPTNENFEEELNQLIIDNLDQFQIWHAENRSRVDNSNGGPALQPGTAQFDSLFSYITTRTFNEGGSRFFDKSALYHVMGAYDFDENSWGKFTVGGNARLYVPNSNGTIFSDTNGRQITNYEYGVFGGWEEKFFHERIKVNATLRVDKNQNFDYLFSPAASFIYQIDELNTLRFSFSSAIRNPTLQDQYLYYNVGRAILLGNITGYDSLVTIDDVEKFLGGTTDERRNYKFDYFTINPIKPERVRTVEAGYRTTLFEKLFVDMNYYFSWYQDFIGFQIALDIEDDPSKGPSDRFSGAQAYRISTNARDQVTTQGFNIGLNYYFANHYTLSGNYSWNVLNTATDDPIIPAFNTPEHKYNLGINGRNIYFQGWDWKGFGFSVNYKWVQGFLFEGSPQFTGRINDYDMLDAQVSQRIEKWDLTLKLGASNLL